MESKKEHPAVEYASYRKIIQYPDVQLLLNRNQSDLKLKSDLFRYFRYLWEYSAMTTVVDAIPLFTFGSAHTSFFPSRPGDWLLTMDRLIQSLGRECAHSPFGDLKSCQNKIDQEIRNALETKDIKLTAEANAMLQESLLPGIRKMLLENDLDIQFEKLNIYQSGGKFARHIDTPRDNVLCTLILELPTYYTGGEFILYGAGNETSKFTCLFPQDVIRVLCFRGSIEHEVLPVLSGTRITLAFQVMERDSDLADDPLKDHHPEEDKDEEKEKEEESKIKWTYLLNENDPEDFVSVYDSEASENEKEQEEEDEEDDEDEEKDGEKKQKNKKKPVQKKPISANYAVQKIREELIASQGSIGYFMHKHYSMDDLERKAWIGIDQILVDEIKQQPDLKWEVVPVLVKKQVVKSPSESSDDQKETTWDIYRFTVDDIRCMLDNKKKEKKETPLQPLYISDVQFINHPGRKVHLDKEEDSGALYTGNESRDSVLKNIYFDVAVLLDLKNRSEAVPKTVAQTKKEKKNKKKVREEDEEPVQQQQQIKRSKNE